MLLTRRLERGRYHPLGFVANEYALAVWAAKDMSGADMDALFDQDMLGDDLDSWLAESNLYKRTFRNCADHCRADPAPLSRQGEKRSASDFFFGPYLRCSQGT